MKFLEKQTCPLCKNELTLYFQVANQGSLFAIDKIKENERQFSQKYLIDKSLSVVDYFTIKNIDKNKDPIANSELSSNYFYQIIFNTPNIRNYFTNTKHLVAFLLCNNDAMIEEYGDYTISTQKACYYLSSQQLFINQDGLFEKVENKEIDSFSNIEGLSVSNTDDQGTDYVNVLCRDFSLNKTTLWNYKVSKDDKLKPDFEPSIFTKEFDFIVDDLSFEGGKEKLMDRLNSWVILT